MNWANKKSYKTMTNSEIESIVGTSTKTNTKVKSTRPMSNIKIDPIRTIPILL